MKFTFQLVATNVLLLLTAVVNASPAPIAKPVPEPEPGNIISFWSSLTAGGQVDWSSFGPSNQFMSGLQQMCSTLPEPITFPSGCTPAQAYDIIEGNSYMCSFFSCGDSDSISILGGGRTNIFGGGTSGGSSGGSGGGSWSGSSGGDKVDCNCPVVPPPTTVYKTKTYKYTTTTTCYSTKTEYITSPTATY